MIRKIFFTFIRIFICKFILIVYFNAYSLFRINCLYLFRCIKGKLIDLLILQCHHIIACNIIE